MERLPFSNGDNGGGVNWEGNKWEAVGGGGNSREEGEIGVSV